MHSPAESRNDNDTGLCFTYFFRKILDEDNIRRASIFLGLRAASNLYVLFFSHSVALNNNILGSPTSRMVGLREEQAGKAWSPGNDDITHVYLRVHGKMASVRSSHDFRTRSALRFTRLEKHMPTFP